MLFVACISAAWFIASSTPAPSETPRSRKAVSPGLLICLGIIGLFIRFPSLSALSAFLSAEYDSVSERATGLLGFASSVMRPLLAVGLFCMYVDAHFKGKRFKQILAVALAPLALLAVASFALNRSAIILPISAMLIAYHLSVRPIPIKRWLIAALSIVAAFVSLGAFRTQLLNSHGGRYELTTEASTLDNLIQAVQLYGQSPFLTGVLFETRTESSSEFGATSLIASMMGPIPALGETFRGVSGTAVYNQLVYGRSTVRDQIIPAWAEVERSAGLVGMVLFAFLIGILMKRWGQFVRPGRSPLEHYAIALGALWISQVTITSVQALTQVAIYFLLPLAVLSGLRDSKKR
jgi:oligosaccharide repeat unit polymerase